MQEMWCWRKADSGEWPYPTGKFHQSRHPLMQIYWRCKCKQTCKQGTF